MAGSGSLRVMLESGSGSSTTTAPTPIESVTRAAAAAGAPRPRRQSGSTAPARGDGSLVIGAARQRRTSAHEGGRKTVLPCSIPAVYA
eukprot:gene13374-biopygen12508